jgi:L-ascorbate metabolism protein UlaG (beta-lactamase superfamily)
MEFDYRGANCVIIKDKNITMIVDPGDLKPKELNDQQAVILATQPKFVPKDKFDGFIVDMPGEYEHADTSVKGIPVPAHLDPDGERATLYAVTMDGVRIAVVGHTNSPIEDDDLENLGVVDIAIVPVGGGGYTLDARDAAAIVRQLDPKVVIPTHFADSHVKYEVPQDAVELFLKEMGGNHEKVSAYKIKSAANLPENLTVVEIARGA